MPARHKSTSKHVSLTESFCSRLRPAEATCVVDHYDLKISNFSLRMLPPSRAHREGLLSWRYTPRFQNKLVALTFGNYPAIGADEARDMALAGWRLVNLRRDPREALRTALVAEAAAEPAAPIDLVEDMWRLYEPRWTGVHRHRLAVVSDFERHVLPRFGERSIHGLEKRELADLLRDLTAEKARGPRTTARPRSPRFAAIWWSRASSRSRRRRHCRATATGRASGT